jgi:fructokinase
MIAHVGESLIDFLPQGGGPGLPPYQGFPGGSPYNCAISAARLGAEVQFLGKISTDVFGQGLFDNLLENGVRTDYVVRCDLNTTLAFVARGASGDAKYSFYWTNTADRSLESRDLPDLPSDVECIQAGSVSLLFNPQADAIAGFLEGYADRIIAFDPNIRAGMVEDEYAYRNRLDRVFAVASIVKISDEDLEWIFGNGGTEAAVKGILGKGADLVLVTKGKDGSEAYTPNARVAVPGNPVEVVDIPVGAGDSFHGASLALLQHWDIRTRAAVRGLEPRQLSALLDYAGRVSAFTCGRAGADPPLERDIERPDP